ncbi:nitrite reductase [Vibrio metschnikovii]|uniref:Nitrite reductase n=1 Tax=Citrobacter freundii TaxID=546 RepID=A0A0K2S362_CITFR|nr:MULTISPECIES: nitrite reductase [Gammaproteobacteria]EKO3572669.1 nitrite reductase [Vibrio metschnikovii]MBA2102007.1 nitrite reductase [Klebsiella pneumoniae subsp. pneumoniae]BAS21549.1 nitrite reductase [Citrobacter freundii]HDZ9205387.1 nitrite reductase [Vibrio cholerae]
MTTNTENANTNQVKSLRDMLVPALLFYVVMTSMFVGLDAFMDKPTSMNLPFMPFLISMVSFTSDARRAWDWRNAIKVVAVLTAVAMLFAFIYQLAVGEMNLLGIGIYPATALLMLAVTWIIRSIGKTAPFQFLGRLLARIGASKWVQRTAAVIVLAGGLAITFYAYWLNHGS